MPTTTHVTSISVLSRPALKGLSTGSADRVFTVQDLRNYEIYIVTTGHATNALVYPVVDGATVTIVNKSGLAVLAKRSGQATPVTIAAGKSAMIYCDGTDYIRLTPDA